MHHLNSYALVSFLFIFLVHLYFSANHAERVLGAGLRQLLVCSLLRALLLFLALSAFPDADLVVLRGPTQR